MNITENIEVHNTLNPKIFRGDIMRQDVRDAALQIVNHFLQQIDMKVNVSDVVLLGSNAAYNYTEDSDFDLHIITNFNRYDANPEIIKELFNARRSNWKNNYDVTIKGYPVEIYV